MPDTRTKLRILPARTLIHTCKAKQKQTTKQPNEPGKAAEELREKLEQARIRDAAALKRKEEQDKKAAMARLKEKLAADKERRRLEMEREQQAFAAQKAAQAQAAQAGAGAGKLPQQKPK